jgi:predicted nucleic acid-binding protein
MASPPASRATSAFVDSSVLIAAAISTHGSARDLILEGLRGERPLYLSSLVLEETERNLRKKRPAVLPAFASFRAVLTASVVDPPAELVQQLAAAIQPKDAPIVAAALHAQAVYLATYDQKHLLSQRDAIRTAFGLVVATPEEILSAH